MLLATLITAAGIMLAELPAKAIQSQIDDVNKTIQKLEDEKADSKQELEELKEEKAYLDDRQAKLDQELTGLAQELTNIQEQLAEKEASLEVTRQELEEARKEEERQYANMKKRIRYLYEKGDVSFLEPLLEAKSLAEIISYGEYVENIYDYDRKMLEEYRRVKDDIAGKEERLETEQEELTALANQQQQAVSRVETLLAEVNQEIGSAKQQISEAENDLAAMEAQIERQKAYEEELEAKKAEEDARRQEEIRRQEEELRRQEEERRQREKEAEKQKNNNSGNQGGGGESGGKGQGNQSNKDQGNQNNKDQGGSTPSAPSESKGDLAMLAALIECEAGGESYEGKLAVGSVIMNRVRSSSFPNSIVGVIYQSGQFSPVASGRFASVLSRGAASGCVQAAQECLSGKTTVSSLYFRRNTGDIQGTVIGNHVFY